MRLRNNLCLVKLAPAPTVSAAGLEMVPSLDVPSCMGKIVQVGPAVREVKPGDVVIFPSHVGDDAGMRLPHLFIPESAIAAVVENT